MKPREVWLPKGRTHSSRDGVIECRQKPPWNWLADIASIGVLILTATGILAISDALQKKGVTGKLDPTQANIQNVRQDTVAVDSRPTNPEPALRPISDDPSSPPTQSTVTGGLPGSSFEPSATGKPAPRRLLALSPPIFRRDPETRPSSGKQKKVAQSVYDVFGGPPILSEKDSPAQRNGFAQYDRIDAGVIISHALGWGVKPERFVVT